MSPLMGHHDRADPCPLLGVKQTSSERIAKSNTVTVHLPPTNKLLHARARQRKRKITNTGWQRMLRTGTTPPKQIITSTSRRLKRSTPIAPQDRESSCRATRAAAPLCPTLLRCRSQGHPCCSRR